MGKKQRSNRTRRRSAAAHGGRRHQPQQPARASRAASHAAPAAHDDQRTRAVEQVALATPAQRTRETPGGASLATLEALEGVDGTAHVTAGSETFEPVASAPGATASVDVLTVERAPATDSSLGSGVRAIRRTRTLADVVQPSKSSARDLSPLEAADAPGMPPARAGRSALLTDTMPVLPHVWAPGDSPGPSVQPPTARQPRAAAPDTRPISGANPSHLTRPLRSESARLTRRLADDPARPPAAAPISDPQGETVPPTRLAEPERLGAPGLVARVALGHACVAFLIALGASVLLLRGDALGYWLLGFVALALPSALFAYLLLRRTRRVVRVSAALLVATHLGALAWAFVVLGPRVELVVLVPVGVWQAHRLGGRRVAVFAAGGTTILALGFTVAAALNFYQPVVMVDATGATVLALAAIILGVGLALLAALSGTAAREKSDRAARARLYELRLLRAEVSRGRAQLEHEAEALGKALVTSLHGKGIVPITVDGPLGPVAEIANAVAERLSTLQKDREDRIRQEGALHMVITAVERGWLGLPWTWPEPSGTLVDEMVALLRTPRPHEHRSAASWHEDIPTLVPLPTLASSSGYWRSLSLPSDPSAPSQPGSSAPDMAQARFGWDDLLSGK